MGVRGGKFRQGGKFRFEIFEISDCTDVEQKSTKGTKF